MKARPFQTFFNLGSPHSSTPGEKCRLTHTDVSDSLGYGVPARDWTDEHKQWLAGRDVQRSALSSSPPPSSCRSLAWAAPTRSSTSASDSSRCLESGITVF